MIQPMRFNGNTYLNTVPVPIQSNICFRDLELGRDPYAINGDANRGDPYGDYGFEPKLWRVSFEKTRVLPSNRNEWGAYPL